MRVGPTINKGLLHLKMKLQRGHSLSKSISTITNFIELPQNCLHVDLTNKLETNFRLLTLQTQNFYGQHESTHVFADAKPIVQ